MSAIVSTIGPNLDIISAREENSKLSGPIDQQIHEAERVLERLKRDLALAQARARLEEQKLVESRRRMEQWRWVNAISEGNPETVRLAAISLVAQSHVVDAAVKTNADATANIDRLQNRIERQIARYFDLQSRRRVGFGERRRDSAVSTPPERSADETSAQVAFSETAGPTSAASELSHLRRFRMNYSGCLVDRGYV